MSINQRDLNKYLAKFEELMPLFHRNIARMDQNCVEKMDLTPHQFIALKTIADTNDCIMSDLSNKLGVTMGNMTSMVDRLIKEGYVAREHDPDDRRVVKVKLTGKGKDIAAKAGKIKKALLQDIFKKLTKKEIETMLDLIEKIAGEQRTENE